MASRTREPGAPDAEGFARFFAAHHRDLARLAYALTGNHEDADDVAADALIAAWRQWDRVLEVDHPVAYVRRIVVNLSASRVRRNVRERRGSALLGPLLAWIQAPDDGAWIDLETAVLALPPRRRACVVLRHVYGLTLDETAQTLGISVGAAKSQTSKGLKQLRGVLEPSYRRGWLTRTSPPRPAAIDGVIGAAE